MHLLTDVPESMSTFAHHFSEIETEWLPFPSTQMSPTTRLVWQELASSASAQQISSPRELPFWSQLILIDQAPESQFDRLRSLFSQSAIDLDPIACVALTGNNFHGHRRRRWATARGNLHLSVAFCPDLPVAEFGLVMTMLPAVAVIDAISAVLVPSDPLRGALGIKWVNDILIAGRKVAGVLTATQSMLDRLTAVTLGIGLNIAVAPPVEPTVFVPATGCLQTVVGDRILSLPALLEALLTAIAYRIAELHNQGPLPLFQAYRAASLVIDQRVRIWEEGVAESVAARDLPVPKVIGTVTEIAADLGLTMTESVDPITSGRLAFDSDCQRLGI